MCWYQQLSHLSAFKHSVRTAQKTLHLDYNIQTVVNAIIIIIIIIL